MTLIWAIGTSSVYQLKNKAIYVPFMLRTSKRRVDQKVLLDSGATESFINPRTIKSLGIKTRKLQIPCSIRNIDGTPNKAGKIVEAANLITYHRGIKTVHVFYIADIGPDNFILGYPFLEANAPIVNWVDAKVEDSTMLSTLDANKWQPPTKRTQRRKRTPLWV